MIRSSEDPIENVGAPEMEKLENQQDDVSQPPDKSETDIVSLKLIRRAIKVKHLQAVEKAVRKNQRYLNKIMKTGFQQDEIEEAKGI